MIYIIVRVVGDVLSSSIKPSHPDLAWNILSNERSVDRAMRKPCLGLPTTCGVWTAHYAYLRALHFLVCERGSPIKALYAGPYLTRGHDEHYNVPHSAFHFAATGLETLKYECIAAQPSSLDNICRTSNLAPISPVSSFIHYSSAFQISWHKL